MPIVERATWADTTVTWADFSARWADWDINYPDVRVDVAFTTTPLAANPTWVDVTAYVKAFQTSIGRQFELDAFQPGTAQVTLDNSTRRFDPLHATGPYYGHILPRKKIRIVAVDGDTYLNLTGTTGSYAATPDAAALDITGDIDIRVRVALDDWTTGATQTLASKYSNYGGENQRSWRFSVDAAGTLSLSWSTDGTLAAELTATSSAPGLVDGSTYWVRVTMDVDDGAGNRVIRFYTSTSVTPDHTAVTWTLVNTVTTAGTTSIFASTAGLVIGDITTTSHLYATGKVYATAVLSGIAGTAVANVDWTSVTRCATTTTDTAGRVWTVVAPASVEAGGYPLFSGFVNTWPQQSRAWTGEVALTATDGFGLLAAAPIATAWEEEIRTDAPTGWWRMGDDTPTYDVCADSSGNGYHGTYKGLPAAANAGLIVGVDNGAVDFDGANDRVTLNPAVIPAAGPLSIEAWIQTSTIATGDQPIAGIFDTAGNSIMNLVVASSAGATDGFPRFNVYETSGGVTAEGVTSIADGNIHHLVGTWDGTDRKARLYIDGALVATTSATATLNLYQAGAPLTASIGRWGGDRTTWTYFDGIIDEVAIYDTALSAARVLAHYEAGAAPWAGDTTGERIGRVLDLAGWPTADRDLDTGISTLGNYDLAETTALAAAQVAEASEGGTFWQAPDGRMTFRDRYAPVQDTNATTVLIEFSDADTTPQPPHYTDLVLDYDDSLIANTVTVDWVGGTEVVTDTASITAYGRAEGSVTTSLTTAAEAQARAQWMLARFKDPQVRPTSVTLRPAADHRLWFACLTLGVGDRVTVTRTPANTGSPISFDCLVEGVTHRAADGINTWETVFNLSPTDIDLGWLILDDTAEGLLDTGKLAY